MIKNSRGYEKAVKLEYKTLCKVDFWAEIKGRYRPGTVRKKITWTIWKWYVKRLGALRRAIKEYAVEVEHD